VVLADPEAPVKVEDVQARLADVIASAGDSEVAHSMEDSLHFDVLKAIASGQAEDPVTMAELAIRTQGIEFSRWCA
jgi:hypothetical protein